MGTAFKILPKNHLFDWGEFESWSIGVGSAPDGWLRGTTANVQRESTNIKFGLYSALISGSSGAIGGLYRTIPNGTDYQGRTFTLGFWGKSASTGPYIELNDGVSSRTVHLNGSNAFVFTTTPPMKIDYSATQLTVGLWATINATAYYDSGVLCEGEDLFTSLSDDNIAVSNFSPNISFKQDQYEISQREGSLIPDSHIQSNNIRLRGTVSGTDTVSARTNFDSLLKCLVSWKTTEKRNLYLYDDRLREVYLKNFDWEYIDTLKYLEFNMQLASPDGLSRSIGRYRSRSIIAATVTEFSIPYNGNFDSKPIFQFIANQAVVISTLLLQNLTTGDNFAYVGTVPSGVSLEIDSFLGTVFNSSVDSTKYFSGEFVGLVRGTNYFRFSGSNCQINVDYFENYL